MSPGILLKGTPFKSPLWRAMCCVNMNIRNIGYMERVGTRPTRRQMKTASHLAASFLVGKVEGQSVNLPAV